MLKGNQEKFLNFETNLLSNPGNQLAVFYSLFDSDHIAHFPGSGIMMMSIK